MRRAPGTKSDRKRCQSRGPAGPEITSYAARRIASIDETSDGRAAGGAEVSRGAAACAHKLLEQAARTLQIAAAKIREDQGGPWMALVIA